MNDPSRSTITVNTRVRIHLEKVWDLWTNPHHILHWNQASADWQTTTAENNLRNGGKFSYRMESKDGKYGFDFKGVYTEIVQFKSIISLLGDGRKVVVNFESDGDVTAITETFEAEKINDPELQKKGWQSILDSFRRYAEGSENVYPMHFEVLINAGKKKVYRIMLESDTYRKWTSVFNASSHYRGTWQKNSIILFLGNDDKGMEAGMVSRIKENIDSRFISIEHLGIVKNGREILCGLEVDKWKGSLENYSFRTVKGKTLVEVDIDSNEEFSSYFNEMWPKALVKLKEICEK